MPADQLALPETMRAWVYRKSGRPEEVLHLESDRPLPVHEGYPILVKVKAVALNPEAYKVMAEFPALLTKKPATPEMDYSGIVVGGDLGGTDLRIGDEVVGMYPGEKQGTSGLGALAEYVCASPTLCARKPENVSFADAACLPLAGLIAYTSLLDKAGAKAGNRVLINGGTGGVGIWAIQIAKAIGCYVVVTCSEKSIDLVKSYGADECMNYKQENLSAALAQRYGNEDAKFDVLFDTIGVPAVYAKCNGFVRSTGRVVVISMPIDSLSSVAKAALSFADAKVRPSVLGGSSASYSFVKLHPEKLGDGFRQIVSWLGEGKLKALIDSQHALEDALDAYKIMMSGRAKGKIVINLD